MGFSTRRGRPKTTQERLDKGTPELRQQRRYGQTREPLDQMLHIKQISEPQHRAGMHFRWLYSLVFGMPHLTSPDFDTLNKGGYCRTDDPAWRIAREEEYHEAVHLLQDDGHLQATQALCIFHEVLNRKEFEDGLTLLAHHWRYS